MTVIRPLNFIPYDKSRALQTLKEEVGYKEYGRKHGESRFTKFFQNYYLPTKFNIDKRLAHLSSQILSGEINREEALKELEKPLYDDLELREDKAYISKKLGIPIDELEKLVMAEGHHYSEFNNWDSRYVLMQKVKSFVQKVLGRNVKNYS